MSHPVEGIDHAYLLTADLDGAADKWRRLGFTLSPRGVHSHAKGTANYTIVFQHDYFEILGVIADRPGNKHQRDLIARDGNGLRAIAGRTRDAQAAHSALGALGIATGKTSRFGRPLPLPEGGEAEASFVVTPIADDEVPVGKMFLCQHITPDLVWHPSLQTHANTANRLVGIFAVAEDVERAARGFSRLFPDGNVAEADGGLCVRTGESSASIYCLTARNAAARWSPAALGAVPPTALAGLQIGVRDLSKARRAVAAGGVRVNDLAGGGFFIEAEDAGGAIVEFVASVTGGVL